MVRRVGFGDGAPPKKDKPKTRPAAKPRQSLASLARSKRDRRAAAPSGPSTPILARVFIGGFLLVWLTGWSAGIVFAIGAFLGEFMDFGPGDIFVKGFLFVWISFALVGWWFAARALLRIIRGEPLQPAKSKP